MSRIHEALRRGDKSAQPSTKSPRPAHTDTILATLGYQAESPATNPHRRLVAALLVTIACAAAYFAWPFWPFRRSVQTPAAVVAHAVAAPRVAARPTPSPSATPTPSRPTPTTPAVASPAASTPAVKPPVIARRPPAPSFGPSRNDFQLALYYQRAGEFDRAFARYKAVLQRDELRVEAHNNLGLLYKNKGLTDEALGEFRRAISIAPRYTRAHNNLGVTLLELGRVDAAAAEFRSVLALEPRNVDAIVNLALALRSAGQTSDGEASLSRALAIEPYSAAAHYNLGQTVRGHRRSGSRHRALPGVPAVRWARVCGARPGRPRAHRRAPITDQVVDSTVAQGR